jgi:hypothetical protein
LRWKLSFAVYCSANVQQKTIGFPSLSQGGTSIYFRVANHPVNSPPNSINTSAFVGTNQAEFNQLRCYPYPAECILRFSAFC